VKPKQPVTDVMLVSVTVEDAKHLRALAFAELQRWRQEVARVDGGSHPEPFLVSFAVGQQTLYERLFDLTDGWVEGR
jgi:hypothetical protein